MNAPADPKHFVPQSLESEQTLLGILLSDARAFDRIVDLLVVADFFEHEHRVIFQRMADMHGAGETWDTIVLFEALGRPVEGAPGSLLYLTQLANAAPGASNVLSYAEIVRARSKKRELMRIGANIQDQAAANMGPTVEEIVAEADVSLLSVSDRNAGDVVAIETAVDEVLAYINDRHEEKEQNGAIHLELPAVDQIVGGIEDGQLIVVGARPSVGKTGVAVHVVQGAAARGKAVLLFSLEMSRREIAMRVAAARSGVSTREMRTHAQDGFPWDRMLAARASTQGQRLYIDDRPAVTVGYVRAKARRVKRQHGLDLVVVDYIGLMKGVGENRVQEIGSISRGLKALAKELGVPIIALAQLNRGVEGRVDKRPLLSDLRDSGDIEQDADVVLMLHRESLYSAEPEWAGVMEVLIRKNRHGPIGDALVDFNAELGILSEHHGANPRASFVPRRVASRGLD